MAEKNSFEKLFTEIQVAVEQLEKDELSIDESMKKYQETMKRIALAKKMLKQMEGRIEEVSGENN